MSQHTQIAAIAAGRGISVSTRYDGVVVIRDEPQAGNIIITSDVHGYDCYPYIDLTPHCDYGAAVETLLRYVRTLDEAGIEVRNTTIDAFDLDTNDYLGQLHIRCKRG